MASTEEVLSIDYSSDKVPTDAEASLFEKLSDFKLISNDKDLGKMAEKMYNDPKLSLSTKTDEDSSKFQKKSEISVD